MKEYQDTSHGRGAPLDPDRTPPSTWGRSAGCEGKSAACLLFVVVVWSGSPENRDLP